MFWSTILPAALFAARASASGFEPMAMEGLLARGLSSDGLASDLERRMEYFGEEEDRPAHIITRRQSLGGAQLNADGTMNMTAWEEEATVACNKALLSLPHSTNPSGTCVCYNLPALNNQTGAFAADLRLYQLSTPSGDFAGIPQQNIQVSLSYQGASVSPVSAAAAASMVVARQAQPAPTDIPADRLKLLQTYLFVGQIDKTRMTGPMNMAVLEALVMPVVTLSAVNQGGQPVSTTVSSNEAAFVAGVFSNSLVMSEFSVANMAVDLALKGLDNSTVPFVLPGVALMVYPIGLIITSVWTVGLCGAIAFGTFQRIGFREQFRRRTQRNIKGGQARI